MHNYPLGLSFKMIAISPQIRVTDAAGRTVMYVKQRAFKLREDVTIFSDEQQQFPLVHMKADRIIDFAATYTIRDTADRVVGAVKGQGMRSIWRTQFAVMDASGNVVGSIEEDNPWVKVADGLVNEIPLVGWVAGLFINPAYTVTLNGRPSLHLVKKPSMLERHFTITNTGDLTESDELLALASVIMMLLLFRGRG